MRSEVDDELATTGASRDDDELLINVLLDTKASVAANSSEQAMAKNFIVEQKNLDAYRDLMM